MKQNPQKRNTQIQQILAHSTKNSSAKIIYVENIATVFFLFCVPSQKFGEVKIKHAQHKNEHSAIINTGMVIHCLTETARLV